MTRSLRRTVRNAALSIGAAGALVFTSMPGAHAAPAFELPALPDIPALGSSNLFRLPSPEELRSQTEDQAWMLRNNIHRDADRLLPPDQARDIKNMVDNTIEAAFPGIIGRHTGGNRPVAAPADNHPCPAAAKACVDVANQVAWLQDGNGNRVGGVVPVSTGATKWDTPAGTHRVTRKVRNEVSREFGNAPMPNSVYFTNNGVAFHAGDPQILSHGCVHLAYAESERFYSHLNHGDIVYVWGAIDYGVPNGRVIR